MSRNINDAPLQMSLFEPATTRTVELTEIDGREPDGILRWFDLADHKDKEIRTCAGDLYVTVNAMMDYGNILDSVIAEWGLTGYTAIRYEIHAARCRDIAKKLAAAIGYDYEAALEKCRKHRYSGGDDDVGQDALTALANKRRQKEGDSE